MKVVVSIIMGSISDKDIMKKASSVLDDFQIGYEMKVISAHRAPEDIAIYAKGAKARGIKVIIAGAGMAAHLPGVIASMTTLPVIGVPLLGSALNGMDSLYSIVQMPTGIPVATVAINGASNAAILALEILALNDQSLDEKLENYRNEIRIKSLESAKEL